MIALWSIGGKCTAVSTFAVTVERIGRVWKHENADLLDMASLDGKAYDFVVGRGQFVPGDIVVYFPVDSVLPDCICTTLNLTGKLAGKDRNRVKTVRLRGNISQGLVCSPNQLSPAIDSAFPLQLGADLTALLGVTKYEPPMIMSQHGQLAPLPPLVTAYDIESAQNFVDIVDLLMDEPCFISEKLEGSHWSATIYKDGSLVVSQRNFRIIPVEGGEHDWYRVLRTQGLADTLRQMFTELSGDEPIEALTLRGEIIGTSIQGNIYRLKDREVRVFEIEINQKPIDADRFLALAERYGLPTVPVIAHNMTLRDWLNGRSLIEASNGQSTLADVLREGIVVKPMIERTHERIGRVFLKQRSPEYLAKSEW
jgi:RNA ligase (TIGR02306 family)